MQTRFALTTAVVLLAASLSAVPLSASAEAPAARTHAASVSAATVPSDERRIPRSKYTLAHPSSSLPRAVTAANPVVHKVYVSVENVTATTADDNVTGLDDTAKITAFVSALGDYWSAQSGGKVSVTLGGIETRSATAIGDPCDQGDIYDTSSQTAFGGLFKNYSWEGTNKHLLILTREGCGLGLGSVGGSGGLMVSGGGVESQYAGGLAFHEFGHNLGFDHSGESICPNSTFDGSAADIEGTCPWAEYDDALDVMGYARSGVTPDVSAAQLVSLGYLTDYVAPTSGTTTVTLQALEGTSGTRAIKITDPYSGDDYYVEYRTPVGYDATSYEFTAGAEQCENMSDPYTQCQIDTPAATGGVRVIRLVPRDGSSTTSIMAVGAISGQPSTTRTDHLEAGQGFAAWDGGFTLAINSLNKSSGATVTVTFPPPSPTSTTLSLSAAGQTYGGAGVTATASVAKVAGVFPDGTFRFTRDGTTLKTVVSVNGSASDTLSATTAAGTHGIAVHFTPTSGRYVGSDAPAATLTVAKATSTTTFTMSSTRVKLHAHKSLKVTVVVPGVSAPTGKLVAYSGTKKLKSYTLASTKKGKLTIVLPGFSTRKTVSITVKYTGSTNISSSVSALRKLKIV